MPDAALYTEYPPPPSLAAAVACTWQQDVRDAAHVHRVLPDGCADIVWIGQAPPIVAGPATLPVEVPLAAGTAVRGIRLRPGWAGYVLGLPADELTDLDVPLQDIWAGSAGLAVLDERGLAPWLGTLQERLCAAPGDLPVCAAVAWLARHPERPVAELESLTGLSRRQLQRRFRAAVGYGPKAFQRIARFQGLLDLARAQAGSAAGDHALAAGYADQAHMAREVRALSGQPAGRLLGKVGSTVSDLFKT